MSGVENEIPGHIERQLEIFNSCIEKLKNNIAVYEEIIATGIAVPADIQPLTDCEGEIGHYIPPMMVKN